MREYRRGFDAIETALAGLLRDLKRLEASHGSSARFFPLIEAAFYERPLQAAEFLEKVFSLPARHPLVSGLKELDGEINALRKTGEDIIVFSKELDKNARDKVETDIQMSQAAILIIFPLFLISGIAMLFFISRNIVNRLGLLSEVVEKTGKGQFSHVAVPADKPGNDEVGILIRKFDHMEDQLAEREEELKGKNEELLRTRKLAAIGTLAAGVAHELNNPLNNIYLSTQVLVRELGAAAPPAVKEVADDIVGQTVRVKKIVGDLLSFARGRDPQLRDVDIRALIRGVFNEKAIIIPVDPEQMEQVFINLFTNAQVAMSGRGEVRVTVLPAENAVQIRISDTGPGIPKDSLEKVFEPFYTTREKGTGLGLAIVFNIIKKHGGDISVESEEGKGTTFTITLPKEQKSISHG
jgi:signal transduction histidine kinase